ncbi:MAG: TIGR04295 family B12-binding domain-containing radical SAM protein [Bryobacteraceae bacterium]
MRYSLINPAWTFEGSIYFGCREPHLPLEYGYSRVLLERAGNEVQIVDAQMDGLTNSQIRERVGAFRPDITVVTTAPSYLFWRCAPPELRIPAETIGTVRDLAGLVVVVGPHASTTPAATLRKLEADVVVMGECEEILPRLDGDWDTIDCISYRKNGALRRGIRNHSADMSTLPALHWKSATLSRHTHHHHRFDRNPTGPGAEMETSRGCPYHCTFCAKDNFRNEFRRRPIPVIEEELDGLIAAGAEYVYFIDEIFLPYRDVLKAIGSRRIQYGIQTRIDLWSEEMIDYLGETGCVSIEAGVESITEAGRKLLDKKCRISTEDISRRLIRAKQGVPFVQANLLDSQEDDPNDVEEWRMELQSHGVWANKPVPLFPYPGSPDYTQRWGAPDDFAWERAHDFYLGRFDRFSDVQEDRPEPLVQLEQLR